jgi:hypothetical protein
MIIFLIKNVDTIVDMPADVSPDARRAMASGVL